MLNTDSAIACPKAQKRKSFDASFKLKAVETAEKKSKDAAARELGVDAKRIREWCSQKDKLVAMIYMYK